MMIGHIQKRYGHDLPHWTMENGIYAVRFRLADSLPQKKLNQWRAEREEIMHAAIMQQRKLSRVERLRLLELRSESVEQYLNAGYGSCCLKEDRIASIVAEALKYFEHVRYRFFSWCIMSNHVHCVVQPHEGHMLSKILHSWKRYTAREANCILGREGEFWQPEYFDRLIRSPKELRRQIAYVWNNPFAAGWDEWKWRWKMDDGTLQAFLQSGDSPFGRMQRYDQMAQDRILRAHAL